MRLRLIQIAMLLLQTVQMVLTFRLWGTAHNYPQVPFFNWLVNAPTWIDQIGMVCVALAALSIAAGWISKRQQSKLYSGSWILLGLSLLGLILLDQHRDQTWVWQIMLYVFCLTCMNQARALSWMRLVTISIYFYSAISKLDASFLETYGQTILDGLLQALGLSPIWSEQTRWGIVLCFPLFELLVAILLSIPKTQRIGWFLSLGMHTSLLLAIGPWGLNHQAPVLIWNLFFLIQNTILFWPVPKTSPTEEHAKVSEDQSKQLAWPGYVMVLVMIFPATEWFNVCDTWPGWGLYSARGSRITLSIDESQVDKLPQEYEHLLAPPSFEHSLRKVDLHRWAFEQTNAPGYPEDRFQLAVAKALLARFEIKEGFQIVHLGTSNRLTGKRIKTTINTPEDLEHFLKRFYINTQAREIGVGR
ncbi:MAG: hypothetical protein JKY95_17235 [Planctomycetaceae bacterium]|nr:hypothetical protein [Planctomycetaceae bacterium]